MRPSGDNLAAILCFAIAFPLVFFRSAFTPEWEDGGYFANGALRVLDGQVIYRDFQHNYPPGRAFSIALLVQLLGHDFLVVRVLWSLFHATAVGFGFLVARSLMSRPFALVAAAAVLLNSAPMNKSAELFLSSAILWILLRLAEGRLSTLVAGIVLALLGQLRHDVAFFGVLLVPVALWFSNGLRRLPAFLGGLVLGVLPLAAYLLYHGAFGIALRDLVFSGFVANDVLSIPFPSLSSGGGALIFWIPVLVYPLALIHGARGSPAFFLVACFGVLVFAQVLPRSDLAHLNKAYVAAHLLEIGLLAAAVMWARERPSPLAWACVLGLALLPLVHLYHATLTRPASLTRVFQDRSDYVDVVFPHGRVSMLHEHAAMHEPVFEILREHAGSAELVVLPAGALLNFLVDMPNPLRYDLLRPGEMAGQEFGEELEANHPRVLSGIRRTLDERKPAFLVDSSEDTNTKLRKICLGWARKEGYGSVSGGRFVLFVRPDLAEKIRAR